MKYLFSMILVCCLMFTHPLDVQANDNSPPTTELFAQVDIQPTVAKTGEEAKVEKDDIAKLLEELADAVETMPDKGSGVPAWMSWVMMVGSGIVGAVLSLFGMRGRMKEQADRLANAPPPS